MLIGGKDDQRTIKIIDMGLAITWDEVLTGKNGPCGTPNYIPPETISGKFHMKSDIWSLGCIFFALLTKSPPFDS